MKTNNALTSPQPSPLQKPGGGCLERLVGVLRKRARAVCVEHKAAEREIRCLTRRRMALFKEAGRLWKIIDMADGKHPNDKLSGGEKATDSKS